MNGASFMDEGPELAIKNAFIVSEIVLGDGVSRFLYFDFSTEIVKQK